ncbi:MAG: hypothetical protein U0N86_11650, partial [Lachnospiraceae bacterium]
SVLIADAMSKKRDDIPIAPSLYSLSNKMDNSLLAVRDINHKYIVVEKRCLFRGRLFSWGKYMVNISLEQCFFKKHLYKPHKTRYNAVKTKKNNI